MVSLILSDLDRAYSVGVLIQAYFRTKTCENFKNQDFQFLKAVLVVSHNPIRILHAICFSFAKQIS